MKPRSARRAGILPLFVAISSLLVPITSAGTAAAQSVKPAPVRVAVVFDERVAALRAQPNVQAFILQRLRRGHKVYLLRSRVDPSGAYLRIALSKNTRGWISREALALPDRVSDAEKILRLAQATADVERLSLCRLLTTSFRSSPLVPQALALFGAEAETVASKVLKRAQRRLESAGMVNPAISTASYFLNEVALDRYNKLGVHFRFDESSGSYSYDCEAWREITRRFPNSPEAITARERLSASCSEH